jgi:lipoyl-dependent peroxiredoxin
MQAVYTAEATSWGGREGRVVSSDGVLDLRLTPPKGIGGDGTNPEQLFAAGWSACFHSALRSVARHDKVELGDSAVTATVSIGRDEEARGFKLEAMIEVEIPGVERSIAVGLVDQAHQLCPYSKATRGNIDVKVTLVKSDAVTPPPPA